jgi:hypothetical protein
MSQQSKYVVAGNNAVPPLETYSEVVLMEKCGHPVAVPRFWMEEEPWVSIRSLIQRNVVWTWENLYY